MIKISPNARHADIKIAATMTADHLDRLIIELAAARATMQPEIPRQFQELKTAATEATQALTECDPEIRIAARSNGGFRLWLRHRGLGWLASEISHDRAIGIRNFLNAKLPDPGGTNLISQQLKDGDRSH